MEKQVTIKSISKVKENKALIHYKLEGEHMEKRSTRTIYPKKKYNVVIFKGTQYLVKFNDIGIAKSIKARNGVVNNEEETPVEAANETKIEETKEQQEGEIRHKKFDEIKACVEANVPVYLHGPAGSGKNHTLKQIAEELDLDFYFTNSVQQEYKITGFIDAGGVFHETEFYKAFKDGGLFFLDEMDASIPEVLVLLNAALANGYFEFPNGKIYAHDDFKVVSAGNTVGSGADEEYVGRLQLDSATLDRFAMIEFDYDFNIEMKIAKGNRELVDFIRGIRKESERQGITAVFSYRCITMVTQLEGKINLREIIKIAVVKGLDKDTINTISTTPTTPGNKYSKALWSLKQAG